VDHVDLFLLFFDGLGQSLTLLLVFDGVLFVLPNALFVFGDGESVLVFEQLDLSDKRCHLFFQFGIFTLQLLVSEACRLDVLSNDLLDFHDLFNNLFDLNWSFNVYRFNSYLALDLSACL
jgi:hypothetical protein